MGIDHSNPYIHSTTVLCDFCTCIPRFIERWGSSAIDHIPTIMGGATHTCTYTHRHILTVCMDPYRLHVHIPSQESPYHSCSLSAASSLTQDELGDCLEYKNPFAALETEHTQMKHYGAHFLGKNFLEINFYAGLIMCACELLYGSLFN